MVIRQPGQLSQEDLTMSHLGLICFAVALIAALFGFAGIAGESIWVAKGLFFVFLALAMLCCFSE